MRKTAYITIFTLLFTSLGLSHCGEGLDSDRGGQTPPQGSNEMPLDPSFHPNLSSRQASGAIKFDNSIPTSQYKILLKDMHALESMDFIDENGAAAQTLNIPKIGPEEYKSFLEERIQVIVAQNFGERKVCTTKDDPHSKIQRGADNYGTCIYLNRKNHKEYFLGLYNHNPNVKNCFALVDSRVVNCLDKLVGGLQNRGFLENHYNTFAATFHEIEVPGIGHIPLNSPRAGIIRLGPGYFSLLENDSRYEQSVSRVRLATLFHEARHSDGNGPSLGFVHAMCPEGHDYANRAACETYTNGAYQVEVQFLKSAQKGCRRCSATGQEILRLTLADIQGRLLPGATQGDTIPEGSR